MKRLLLLSLILICVSCSLLELPEKGQWADITIKTNNQPFSLTLTEKCIKFHGHAVYFDNVSQNVDQFEIRVDSHNPVWIPVDSRRNTDFGLIAVTISTTQKIKLPDSEEETHIKGILWY